MNCICCDWSRKFLWKKFIWISTLNKPSGRKKETRNNKTASRKYNENGYDKTLKFPSVFERPLWVHLVNFADVSLTVRQMIANHWVAALWRCMRSNRIVCVMGFVEIVPHFYHFRICFTFQQKRISTDRHCYSRGAYAYASVWWSERGLQNL